MICQFRSCCICYYLVLIIHSVLSVTVNEFYSFGVENGDTRYIQIRSFTNFMFSDFSITNLLKNENLTVTRARIYFESGVNLQTEKNRLLIRLLPLSKSYGGINNGDVFYRTTDNTTLLNRAKEDIKQSNLTQCDFNPRHLIMVTWVNYFNADLGMSVQTGNTFQLIITTDETSTFAIILFGEINNPFPTESQHIRFIDPNTYTVLESINLPYVNDITQAPNLTFNSNVPGTYIIKLSADVPCSQPPSCPVKGTQECKKNLARLVCQKMINDNINPIPKACDSL